MNWCAACQRVAADDEQRCAQCKRQLIEVPEDPYPAETERVIPAPVFVPSPAASTGWGAGQPPPVLDGRRRRSGARSRASSARIISNIASIVVLVAVVGGGYLGIKYLLKRIDDHKSTAAVESTRAAPPVNVDVSDAVVTAAQRSIGTVANGTRTGSGWIARSGIVITTSDLVSAGDSGVEFTGADSQQLKCNVLRVNTRADLAELACPTGQLPPLAISVAKPPVGLPFYLLSSVGDSQRGTVASVDTADPNIPVVHTQVQDQGASGAPFIDSAGHAFAMSIRSAALTESSTLLGNSLTHVDDLVDHGDAFATNHRAENRARLLVGLGLGGAAFVLGALLRWHSGRGRILATALWWGVLGGALGVAGVQGQIILGDPGALLHAERAPPAVSTYRSPS